MAVTSKWCQGVKGVKQNLGCLLLPIPFAQSLEVAILAIVGDDGLVEGGICVEYLF